MKFDDIYGHGGLYVHVHVCERVSHLWEALLVHMVHHDYLIIIAGGGASWAERTNKEIEQSK